MATSHILTVRVQEDELIKLDESAKLQNRPRSQSVQDAVTEFIRFKALLAPDKCLR